MEKIKSINFEMEVAENGKLSLLEKYKPQFATFSTHFQVGEKVSGILLSPDEVDYKKWLAWHFGILIKMAQFYMEIPEPAMRDKNVCNDMFKDLYIDIRAPHLLTEYVSQTGKKRYRTFSLNLVDGVSKEVRIDYSNFIKECISNHQFGTTFEELENDFRLIHGITPIILNYK